MFIDAFYDGRLSLGCWYGCGQVVPCHRGLAGATIDTAGSEGGYDRRWTRGCSEGEKVDYLTVL